MPTFQVVAPCHKDLVLNSAFASDYGDLISNNRIDAWIYGHSHTNIDAEIGGTKVLSNQMGYVFQNEHLMNGFDSGKYENKEDFFRDWHSFNPMETRWFHVASSIYMEGRAIRFTDRKYTRFVVSNYSSYVSDNNNTITMNGAGKLLPVFLPICADWWMPLLSMLMASMNM